MPVLLEGEMDASGLRFAIVASRFNRMVGEKLVQGALDALARHGAADDQVHLAWVPGAMELPVAARAFAKSGKFDAVICIGTVIRGETPHFDYVCYGATRGIVEVALETGVPTLYGVLTCENLEQAMDRAGGKAGNKGWDAAVAAIETAALLKKVEDL